LKLFSKYNRINISATILIFLVGSMAFYFVLQYVLIRQLDDTLWSEKQEVVDYVNSHHQLPDIQNTKNQWIEVVKINALLPNTLIQTVPLKKINEQEYIRQLIFSVKANNQYYQFTVNKSEAETEDLLQLIILVTTAMIGLMLLFNYLINRKLVTNTWKPFYNTIDSIKDYAAHLQPLALSKEPIDEINLLNESINSMTERISKDYLALRSFTENASHEMQTPLAIIRSKVESLLQDAEGNEKTIQQPMAT
jgi:signal transduction histidine kinase